MNDKKQDPFYMRVPQELVDIWDAKHPSDGKLSDAYDERDRLQRWSRNISILLIPVMIGLFVVDVCGVGWLIWHYFHFFSGFFCTVSGIGTLALAGWTANRNQDYWKRKWAPYHKAIQHFEVSVGYMMDHQQGPRSLWPDSAIYRLEQKARELQLAEATVREYLRKAELADRDGLLAALTAEKQLREYFNPFYHNMWRFKDYYKTPPRRDLFDTVRVTLKR